MRPTKRVEYAYRSTLNVVLVRFWTKLCGHKRSNDNLIPHRKKTHDSAQPVLDKTDHSIPIIIVVPWCLQIQIKGFPSWCRVAHPTLPHQASSQVTHIYFRRASNCAKPPLNLNSSFLQLFHHPRFTPNARLPCHHTCVVTRITESAQLLRWTSHCPRLGDSPPQAARPRAAFPCSFLCKRCRAVSSGWLR